MQLDPTLKAALLRALTATPSKEVYFYFHDNVLTIGSAAPKTLSQVEFPYPGLGLGCIEVQLGDEWVKVLKSLLKLKTSIVEFRRCENGLYCVYRRTPKVVEPSSFGVDYIVEPSTCKFAHLYRWTEEGDVFGAAQAQVVSTEELENLNIPTSELLFEPVEVWGVKWFSSVDIKVVQKFFEKEEELALQVGERHIRLTAVGEGDVSRTLIVSKVLAVRKYSKNSNDK